MSPLEIEIIIHYHISPDGAPFPRGSAAATEAQEKLAICGLLFYRDGVFYANREPLNLYIETICNTPLPKQKWVIE